MIRQIEEKVVNRLRQVTSAIRQDGVNQVSIITSSAEREAAIEFAKAATMRPHIVGQALDEISREPAVAAALFEVLETQRTLDSKAGVTLLPAGATGEVMAALLATTLQAGSTRAGLEGLEHVPFEKATGRGPYGVVVSGGLTR